MVTLNCLVVCVLIYETNKQSKCDIVRIETSDKEQ